MNETIKVLQVSSWRTTSLWFLSEHNGCAHPRAELTVTPTGVLLEVIEHTVTALQSYVLSL